MARRSIGVALAVLGSMTGVASLAAHGEWRALLVVLGILATVIGVWLVGPLIRDFLRFRSSVRFVKTFAKGLGRHFQSMAVLQRMCSTPGEVTVLARTGVNWLIGDDTTEGGKESFRNALIAAIAAGSSLRIIVPKHLLAPHAPVYFPEKEDGDARLREHLRDAIAAYEAVRSELPAEARSRLRLSLADQPVFFSMAKIKEARSGRRSREWLCVSMRLDFKRSERQRPQTKAHPPDVEAWDPHIVFRNDAWQFQDYEDRMDLFINGQGDEHAAVGARRRIRPAIDYEEYNKVKKKLLEDIQEEVRTYRHGSPLRHDTAENLAAQAVRHHVARRRNGDSVPPVCVQLLVTHECPGHCEICTQSERSVQEPTLSELQDILSHIASAGTKSVILSGGEPLYRSDFRSVLQHARKIGLGVGLLTRGIKPPTAGGEEPPNLTPEDVAEITHSCQWVQLSIDSFRPEHYRDQGREWIVAHVAAVARQLWDGCDRDATRAELCYTIQRSNVTEVDSLLQDARDAGFPSGMPVRLKLAHGPFEKSKSFVCTAEQLVALRGTLRDLAAAAPDNPTNAAYLLAMLDDATIEDAARGLPVTSQLRNYQRLGYFCAVLDMTCTIDCDGQVYSCCHLFDDNNADSSTRQVGRFERLRDGQYGIIPPAPGNEAYFSRIWMRRKSRIPLADEHDLHFSACARCTRHMHQNAFLNRIYELLEKGDDYDVADDLLQSIEHPEGISARPDGASSSSLHWCSRVSESFWL